MHRENTPPPSVGFMKNVYLSLGIWFFVFVSLGLFRIVFLFLFRARLGEGLAPIELALALAKGAWVDMQTASTLSFGYLVLSLLWVLFGRDPIRLRSSFGELLCAVSALIYVASFFYFKEFNSHFHFVLFQMDAFEIKSLGPILWRDYNLLGIALVLLTLIVASRFLLRNFDRLLTASWEPLSVQRVRWALLLTCLTALGGPFAYSGQLTAPSTGRTFLEKAQDNPFNAIGALYQLS